MIYFVTETFLKDNTPITGNVDAKDLAPFMRTTVTTYVYNMLGYTFTHDLLTKYNAGTLNAKESELVEFLQYMVSYYAAYDAAPHVSFRLSNKGVQSQSGDYSASEGISAVEYVRREYLKFAKVFESNTRAFLELNKDEFALYTDETNQDIEAPDGETNAKSSVTWV